MAKFKLGLDSLTYILIHYNNGQTLKFYSIDWGRGIKGKDKSVGIARLENNMLKNKATWERATLHEADNKILSYYHHSTGIKRLSKAAYNKALKLGKKYQQNISIYLIPNRLARQNGKHKGTAINHLKSLEEIPQYFANDVKYIQVYLNGKLTYHYTGSAFKEVI